LSPTTTIASTLTPLYFIAGKEQLVRVDVPLLGRDPTLFQLLSALIEGPMGPSASATGLRSAIPPDAQLTATQDAHGVVTVDFDRNFLADTGGDQRLAIAQIVLTLTSARGISQVRFTEGHEPRAVDKADGSIGEPSDTLYFNDYKDLLDNSTPTTLATTTTTTTLPGTTTTTTTTTLPVETTTTGSAPTETVSTISTP
jgi:spore germination protein GerM